MARSMRNSFIYLLVIVAIIAVFFTLFSSSLGGSKEVSISEVISMAARGQLESIEVRGDKLTVTGTSGETFTSRKEKDPAWWRYWSGQAWTLWPATFG